MANKWVRQEVLEIVAYIAMYVIGVGLLAYFGGLALRGFEPEIAGGQAFSISNYLGGYLIYIVPLIISLCVVIFPITRLLTLAREQHPATQDKPRWYTIFQVSLIHSPEENGALYRLFRTIGAEKFMRWNLSMFRVFILSVLVFGLYGLLTISSPQYAIAGVPETPQQVTAASDIIFSSIVPAFTENGMLLFILCLMLGLNAWISSRFKLGVGGFFFISLPIFFLVGYLWASIHNIVYPNSDVRRLATFIFGSVGAALTVAFGSFIPWLVWHISNNAFIKINQFVTTNADIYFFAIIIWVAILILYITGEIIAYRFRKKKREKVVVPT